MARAMTAALLAASAALGACRSAPPVTPLAAAGNLAHAVFFDLLDPRQTEELVRDCRLQLASIPGVRLLEVGTRSPEFIGQRNNSEFEVALWVLFDDRAAHDAYQVHPRHRALVERWTPRLAGIEVFDAYLER